MKVKKHRLVQSLISPVAHAWHSGTTNATGQIKGEVRELSIRGTRISGAVIASNTQAVDRLGCFNDNEVQAGFGPPALQEEKAPAKSWISREGDGTITKARAPDVETRPLHRFCK
jgi:hypothetical protein